MGQYYKLINFDRREIADPGKLGLPQKLQEQAAESLTAAHAMILLVSTPEHSMRDIPHLGRWAGNRVAFVGDYARTDAFDSPMARELFGMLSESRIPLRDISGEVAEMLQALEARARLEVFP